MKNHLADSNDVPLRSQQFLQGDGQQESLLNRVRRLDNSEMTNVVVLRQIGNLRKVLGRQFVRPSAPETIISNKLQQSMLRR